MPSSLVRRFGIGAVVALAAVSLSAIVAVPASTASSKGTFTIFMAEDATGPNAFNATINYPPMEIACKQINQAGGVMGHNCATVSVDTAGDAADALPRLTSAIAKASDPAAVVGLNSTVGPALIPATIGQHVVAMTHAGEQQFFNYPNPMYLYMLQPPDEETGFGLAFAAVKDGFKHPAVIMTDNPDTAPIQSGALQALKALKVQPVINLTLAQDQASYATEAARALAAHPDSFIVELDPQTAGSFFQSVGTELGKKFSLPIFTDQTGDIGSWESAVGNTVGKQQLRKLEYIVAPATSSISSEGYKILNSNFYTYPGTKGNPLGIGFSGPLYDSPILVALAMLESHSLSPSVFAPYIYKVGTDSPGSTEVQTFAQGKAALAKGKKIYYFGASGNFDWTSHHSIIQPVIMYHMNAANNPGPTLLTISKSSIEQGLGIR